MMLSFGPSSGSRAIYPVGIRKVPADTECTILLDDSSGATILDPCQSRLGKFCFPPCQFKALDVSYFSWRLLFHSATPEYVGIGRRYTPM